MGCFRADTDHRRCIVGDGVIVEWETLAAHECHTAMCGSVLCIIGEESSEGMDPPRRSNGMTMRIGRRTSLMARTSSLVGFPLMGGKTSNASLNRSVMVSGRMVA
jgi:hypothetical protein